MKLSILSYCLFLVIFLVAGCGQQENGAAAGMNGIIKGLTDEQLMDLVERQTFRFFWEGAESHSGLALDRYHLDEKYREDDDFIISTGGSGFGVMAILAGIERGYISREEGFNRFLKIMDFIEKAEKFHGVFPHWWNGQTGKTKPFAIDDNGAVP